ncbi:unnamed protein product [Bursaphelenchus xylophilus]|uniref:(pine wood nematode) hypothetical protein n=1 Tax=Bursaphelenchus xylophilus TaxID=6326 RepID=A0A1I7RTR7_BURXY|nr:unnamed protein product [Bursaphelenchus xylophilus]CAG9122186.1 unnamed protein product [Bursaphelenchus xylophilus]
MTAYNVASLLLHVLGSANLTALYPDGFYPNVLKTVQLTDNVTHMFVNESRYFIDDNTPSFLNSTIEVFKLPPVDVGPKKLNDIQLLFTELKNGTRIFGYVIIERISKTGFYGTINPPRKEIIEPIFLNIYPERVEMTRVYGEFWNNKVVLHRMDNVIMHKNIADIGNTKRLFTSLSGERNLGIYKYSKIRADIDVLYSAEQFRWTCADVKRYELVKKPCAKQKFVLQKFSTENGEGKKTVFFHTYLLEQMASILETGPDGFFVQFVEEPVQNSWLPLFIVLIILVGLLVPTIRYFYLQRFPKHCRDNNSDTILLD